MKTELTWILIGIMALLTLLYFGLKKFISWVAGKDDGLKYKKRTSFVRLTTGYIQIMILLALCIVLVWFFV